MANAYDVACPECGSESGLWIEPRHRLLIGEVDPEWEDEYVDPWNRYDNHPAGCTECDWGGKRSSLVNTSGQALREAGVVTALYVANWDNVGGLDLSDYARRAAIDVIIAHWQDALRDGGDLRQLVQDITGAADALVKFRTEIEAQITAGKIPCQAT